MASSLAASAGGRRAGSSVRRACGFHTGALAASAGVTAVGLVFGGFAPRTRCAPSMPVGMIVVSAGSGMPSSSIACLSRIRSSRATSSLALARVLMTRRMTSASPEIDSRPQTSGCSRMRVRHFGSFARPFAVSSIAFSTRSMSASVATARSMMTRDQPCDRLPMRRISPLRTYQSVPFTSRTWVTRTLTYSTIPEASPRSTTSPMPDLVLGDDEDAVEDVLHDVLRTEAETGADGRGQQRQRAERVRGEDVDDQQHRDDHHRHVDDVLQDRARACGCAAPAARRRAASAPAPGCRRRSPSTSRR